MKKIRMDLGEYSYDIVIEDDVLSHLSFYISQVYTNKKIYVITDENVEKLYLNKVITSLKNEYEVDYVVIKPGEDSKTLTTFCDVVNQLLEKNIRRNELLIALGGGVIGDLTGFIASTIYRGVPYIGIPTSLLSQMDSSIGGKTGIDFQNRKNIIGCFNQPKMVIIDPLTLNSLPKCEFNNGMYHILIEEGNHQRIRIAKLCSLWKYYG